MRKRAIKRGQVSVPSDVRRKLQIGPVPVRAFRGSGPGGQVAALLRERKRKSATKPFAICIDDTDYKASLIRGKVYQILPDPKAARDDLVRIVDESGEDYLYHRSYFVFVDFPLSVKTKLSALESTAS